MFYVYLCKNDCIYFCPQLQATGIQECNHASHSFAVEMKALNVVNSSSEQEPHICSELAVSSPSPPSEDRLDDADEALDLSNADFRDLGDALISILGLPAEDKEAQNPLSGSNEQTPQFTSVITNPRFLHSSSPPHSAEATLHPAYPSPSSSVTSSSSYDDIASIISEEDKSPMSVQDIVEAASREADVARRKSSASSESDDENKTKNGKAIKLPQSKKTVATPLTIISFALVVGKIL